MWLVCSADVTTNDGATPGRASIHGRREYTDVAAMTTIATSIKLTARRARGDMASSQEAAFSLTPAIMSSALCAAKSRPGPGGLSVRRNRPRVDLDSILRRRQRSDVDQGRGRLVSVQPSHQHLAATAGVHGAHQGPGQVDESGHRPSRLREGVAHGLHG